MNLESELTSLGEEMTECSKLCAGIVNERSRGVIPRCLFLERNDEDNDGCVVVGINPGAADNTESDFYLKHGTAYQSAVEYWQQNLRDSNLYYKRLRNLVRQLGRKSPILWTELVKCEGRKDEELPLQTFRVCTGLYLSRELALVPGEWPVIAVGRQAYNALAFLYPNRTTVGVPHPTGSFGNFAALFENAKLKDGILRKDFKIDFMTSQGQAIWLS